MEDPKLERIYRDRAEARYRRLGIRVPVFCSDECALMPSDVHKALQIAGEQLAEAAEKDYNEHSGGWHDT